MKGSIAFWVIKELSLIIKHTCRVYMKDFLKDLITLLKIMIFPEFQRLVRLIGQFNILKPIHLVLRTFTLKNKILTSSLLANYRHEVEFLNLEIAYKI